MKEIMKWFGAVLISCGVFGSAFVFAGCGAAPEDEQLGQTEEPILAPASGALLVGTDTSGGQCKTSGPSSQDCRWMRPYMAARSFANPARYSVLVSGAAGSDKSLAATAVNGIIVPTLNAKLASPTGDVSHGAVIDLGASANQLTIFDDVNRHAVVGDTVVSHYERLQFSGCQSAAENETVAQPGTFRSCASATCAIDYASLHANFSATLFTGNQRQVLQACILGAMGQGLQSANLTWNFSTLNTNAQGLSNPLFQQQLDQLRIGSIGPDAASSGPTTYTVPCTAQNSSGCIGG